MADTPENQHKQWLMNVSHEIRTPMVSVIGYPGATIHFATDPLKVTEYATAIEQSGQRALDLIDGMLELFKQKPEGVTLADLNARFAAIPFRPGYDGASAYDQKVPKGPQGAE